MEEVKPKHYVDNVLFYDEMVKFLEARLLDEDVMPNNYIGDCIIQICNRLSFRPNFIGYAYRQEMVSDAIENCVRYVHKFDHVKYKSPFAYFSQIAFYAMVRRIQSEHKQMAIKAKMVQSSSIYESMVDNPDGDDTQFFNVEENTTLKYLYDFEIRIDEKKKKDKEDKVGPLDKFVEV